MSIPIHVKSFLISSWPHLNIYLLFFNKAIKSILNLDLNCDFEDGFCNWIQSESRDTSNWIRASTLLKNSPQSSGNHSIYIYMSNTDDSKGSKNSILISPELYLPKSEKLCLHFDFHFHVKDSLINYGELIVKKRVKLVF